ncbi:MAG: exo-alpha-sialidase, partial [Candidatus Aenigmatarchaeota archaeon]
VLNLSVGLSSVPQTVLYGGNVSVGDKWNCTVWPYDGYENGTALSANTTAANLPPYWSPPPTNQTAQVGVMFVYDANATDPEGSTLTYRINDTSFTINSSTGVINKTYTATGAYPVKMNVTDGTSTINATFYINVLTGPGGTCTKNSDCGSEYCRHDWDWALNKKMCAIDSTSCVRDNASGVYGNISSMGLFATEYTDNNSQVYATEPFRRCNDGHWSEEPYRPTKNTYHLASFIAAGTNTSGYINVPMNAGIVDAVMEVSGETGDDWTRGRINDNATNTQAAGGITQYNGVLYVTYTDYANNTCTSGNCNHIKFAVSTDEGATWVNHTQVDHVNITQYDYFTQGRPAILAVNNTLLYIVWGTYNEPYAVYVSNSTDGGRTWSNETRVDDALNYGLGHVALGYVNKSLTVVWTGMGYNVLTSNSSNGGATFDYPRTLPNMTDHNSGDAFWMAYNSSTEWVIYNYWTGGTTFNTTHWFFQNSTNTRTWSDQWNRKITKIAGGDVYMVWNNNTLWLLAQDSGNPGDYNAVNFTLWKSTNSGFTWTFVSTVGDYIPGVTKEYPQLVIENGTCNFYAIWGDRRAGGGHWELFMSKSTDCGATWTNDTAVGTPDWYNGGPDVYVGEMGLRQYGVAMNGKLIVVGRGVVSDDAWAIQYRGGGTSYPVNPSVDIGNNGVNWNYAGTFDEVASPENVTFTDDLRSIIRTCTCSGCTILGGVNCSVPINLTSGSAGKLVVDNMNVYYEYKAPTIGSVLVEDDIPFPYDQVDLAAGQTKQVVCNGTVNDMNGGFDINASTPTGRFYASPATFTCSGDNNNCYYNSSCAWLNTVNSTAQYAECRFNAWYNAKNTTGLGWTCNLTVVDTIGLPASGTDTTDINPLLAVGTPAVISFGSMAVGDTSANDVNATIRNYGNVQIDLALNGSALSCNVGSVPATYLRYNCTHYGQTYGTNMAYLPNTLSSANCTGFDLAKNSTATTQAPMAPAKNLPWKIKVPPAVFGNCQGTIWFAAVAG